MNLRADLAAAFGLAVLAHAAVFGLSPRRDGFDASGAGGTDLVSLDAANAGVAALVAEWERPPEQVQPEPAPVETPRSALEAVSPTAPASTRAVAVAPVRVASVARTMPVRTAPAETPAALPVPATEVPVIAESAPPETAGAPPEADRISALPEPEPERIESTEIPDRSDLAPASSPRPAPMPNRPERVAEAVPRTSAAAPSQRRSSAATAAGTGGGTTAGTGRQNTAPSRAQPSRASIERQWGAAINAQITRSQRYPANARGATGKSVLRVTVAPNGRLSSVGVVRSSGNRALDRAAVQAVKRAGRFARAPGGHSAPITITVALNFRAPR